MWHWVLGGLGVGYVVFKLYEEGDKEDPRWLPKPVYDAVDAAERVIWDE